MQKKIFGIKSGGIICVKEGGMNKKVYTASEVVAIAKRLIYLSQVKPKLLKENKNKKENLKESIYDYVQEKWVYVDHDLYKYTDCIIGTLSKA